MKSSISALNLCIFIVLTVFATTANAEYYIECNDPIPNVVTINCKGHHCSYKARHYTKYHQVTRHYRNHHEIEKNCDQDMATGDDMACFHPDMQIN